MRLLLDTHVLLWWLLDDSRLSAAARAALADGSNTILVSAASAWEVAIKASLGKLPLPPEAEARIADAVVEAGFIQLPVTFAHAAGVRTLPWRHRDPFDRLLVAQSKVEGLTLVTGDSALGLYGVDLLW